MPPRAELAKRLAAIDAFDRRVFELLTREERQAADWLLKGLSNAANQSQLWLLIAFGLAMLGRRQRAALGGVLAIAMTSTLVNLPLKYLARRERPRFRKGDRPLHVPMPGSFSFPSGHSASAFAFLTGAGLEEPRAVPLLAPIAAAVAYSRVHLRVHYPLDVAAGAAIGAGMGLASRPVLDAAQQWWDGLAPVPARLRPQTNRVILVRSGHARSGEKISLVRRRMAEHGLQIIDELDVENVSRLSTLLGSRNGPAPMVVAAGGDGTVGAVADSLVGKDVVMGVIPLGTSNDFARSMEIPMRIEGAVRLLSRGPIRRVDAGKLSHDGQPGRHFVHAAATGLNVAFARFATRADLRERLGRLTYAVAAAMAVRDRPVFECEVSEGQRSQHLRLVHLSVVNAPVFGGFLDLRVPDTSPDDRTLHVIMIEHLPIRRLIRSALYPAIGVHRRIRGFQLLATSRITVRPSKPMDVTLDGEVSGKIPGTFEVVPSALQVIAPLEGTGHP